MSKSNKELTVDIVVAALSSSSSMNIGDVSMPTIHSDPEIVCTLIKEVYKTLVELDTE